MKKIISLLLVGLVIISSLTGCKSMGSKKKKTTEKEVKTYTEEEYKELEKMITEKDNELALYDERYKSLDAFKKKDVVNAGVWTFNKINDKIVLNGKVITGTEASIDSVGLESFSSFGNNIKINTLNWITESDTSRLDLYKRDANAFGKILFYEYAAENYDSNSVAKEMLIPYFDKNGIEVQNKKEIFINQSKVGEEISGTISIIDSTENGIEMTVPAKQIIEEDQLSGWGLDKDSELNIKITSANDEGITKDMTFRIGVANVSGNLIYYEFLYDPKLGKSAVDSLINNVYIKDKPLYLK